MFKKIIEKQILLFFLLLIFQYINALKNSSRSALIPDQVDTIIEQYNEDNIDAKLKLLSDIELENQKELAKQIQDTKNNKIKGKTKITIPIETAYGIYVRKNAASSKISVHGNVEVEKEINAESFKTKNLKMEELAISELTNDKQPIKIYGGVSLFGLKSNQPIKANSLIVMEYNQWSLVDHDHFDQDENLKGWNFLQLTSCESKSGNKMLGGHCSLSDKEIVKTFTNLPPHNYVRIQGDYHMLDNWEGEYGYMKADNKTNNFLELVWKQKGRSQKNSEGINICGNSTYDDPLMNNHIDKIIEHTGDTINIILGSTLKKNPCEASFGIDNLMVYIKNTFYFCIDHCNIFNA